MSTATRTDRRSRAARAQGRDAREDLLDAAVAVFAERGYRDASVDEIAQRAGYSKGAVYWHFDSKDDLFLSLLEARIEEPWRRTISMLESAGAERDMSVEASRHFAAVLRGQRELLLIENEYWSQAMRDPKLRKRYAARRAELRKAFGKAIATRLETLGAPPVDTPPEVIATIFISLMWGITHEQLTEPSAVPDDLLGRSFALVYAGLVARAS